MTEQQIEISMKEFLENQKPGGKKVIINNVLSTSTGMLFLSKPDIELHCSNDTCSGIRIFKNIDSGIFVSELETPIFLNYTCKNCEKTRKIFAITINNLKNSKKGLAYKIGEFPQFGSPVPSKAISLVGPDREMFLNGRRAENQGLGIGAFAYYRRVIENQKDRLLSEILKVAEKVNASKDIIEQLKQSQGENQFSKVIDELKPAVPEILLIDGHNPLILLHQALSEGLHANTDEECLEAAETIRLILFELSEKIATALQSHEEIRSAINRLTRKKKT